MRKHSNAKMVSPRLLVVFSVILVAVQAVEPRIDFNVPDLSLDSARIVGGEDARKGEFPHQVSLQWAPNPSHPSRHFCGGSIIDSRWILTAGHCVRAVPSYGSFVIKAGKHYIRDSESTEQKIRVSRTFVHSSYRGGVGPYDIALLKLEYPLKLNTFVAVIKLPKYSGRPSERSVLSGWGSIASDGKTAPNTLQKIYLPILDLKTCRKSIEHITGRSPLHTTNICTGFYKGKASACKGDSGGPLIRKTISGADEVIGVVSWGVFPCATKGAPSVYVDVAQFVDWIRRNIAKN